MSCKPRKATKQNNELCLEKWMEEIKVCTGGAASNVPQMTNYILYIPSLFTFYNKTMKTNTCSTCTYNLGDMELNNVLTTADVYNCLTAILKSF